MPPPPTGIFDPFVEPAPTPAPAPAPTPAPTGIFDAFVSAPKPPPTLGERALDYASMLPVAVGKAGSDIVKAGEGIADLTGLVSPETVAGWREANAARDQELNQLVERAPGAQGATDLAGLGATFMLPGGQVVGPTVFGGERAYDARAKGLSRPAAAGLGALDAASSIIVPGAVEAAGERFLAPALGRAAVDPIARAAIEHGATGLGLGLSQAAVSSTYDPQRAAAEAEAAPWFALGAGAVGAAGARLSDTLGAAEPSPPMGRVEPPALVEATPAETPAPTGVFDKFVGNESAAAEPAPAAATPERTGPFQPGPRVVGPTVRGVEGPRVNGPKVQRRGFGEPEPAPVENPPAVENPAPAEPGAMTAYRQQLAALTPDERVALAQDIAHVGGANPPDPVSALAGIRQALELRKPRPERQIAEPVDTLSTGESSHEARQPEVPEAVREGSDVPQGAPGEPAVPGDAAEGRVVPAGEGEGPVPAGEGDAAGRLLAFDEETRQQRIASQKRINELRADARANPGPNAERSRALDHELKRSKGDAFSRAAKRRALVQGDDLSKAVPGGLTAKELAAARVDAAAKKGRVTTPDGPGHVVSTPFGKVRVKLDGGETKTYERAQVQRAKEPADAGRGRSAGGTAPAQPAERAAPVLPEAARARQPKPDEPVAVPAVGADRAAAGDGAGAGRRAPDAGGPVVEPAANQRVTSTRPDLAIPSDQPAAREVFKEADARRTATGKPEVVSRASTREAAAERLSTDFGSEHAKLKAKVERGEALNAEERVMGKVIVERLTAAGDLEEAVRAADVYRRGSAEGARALGIGVDPLEPFHERAQREVRDALLEDQRARNASIEGDVKRHDELLKQHAAQIHETAAKVEQLTGINPLALDQPAKPKAARSKLTKASLEVDREFTDLAKQLKDAVKSALKGDSVGAMGGEVVDVLTKMIVNRLKKGAITAAEMAATLVRAIPELRKNAKLQAAFKDAWNAVKKDEPVEDAGTLFAPTLDEQVAAAEKRRAAALERHAAAFGQTPEERLSAMEAKQKAKAEIPPEVAAINAEIKELGQLVRNRDHAIAVNARRVLDAIATVKSDAWDKVYEFRRNIVHTSLKLPLKKVASDVLNTLHHALVDWVGRPLANKIPGGADKAALGDIPHVIRGILPGLRHGVQIAWRSWLEQRNVWQDEIHGARVARAAETGEAFQDEFHQPRAIAGKVGTLTGWNIRATGAFQALAETVLAHMQVGAEAYRRAFDMTTGERLTGQALEDHMTKELGDLASESWTQADTTAKDITGVTPHKNGPVGFLNRLANLDPHKSKNSAEYWLKRGAKEATRHLFLFRTLPFNFLVKGIYHMTPLNGLSILSRGAKSLTGLAFRGREGWTYKRAQFNTDIAKHALAWGGLLAASAAMDDEDGKPAITGYGNWSPTQSDAPLPPLHSVKIGGTWHDYAGLGPVAHALGFAVDVLRGVKRWGKGEPAMDALDDVSGSMKGQAVNDTWLHTLADIDQAKENPTAMGKFAGTLASSFYPTMAKDLGKATQAYLPDRQVKEHGFWNRASQVAGQQLGIPGLHTTPSVDIFGREIAKDDPLAGPVTSFVMRAVNPFDGPEAKRDEMQPYRDMIVRWNEEHPTEQLKPKAPPPFFTLGKKRVDLTEQQYHDLCVDAGQRVVKVLARRPLNTDHPTAKDVTAFTTIVSDAQSAARDKMKATIARGIRSAGSTAPR